MSKKPAQVPPAIPAISGTPRLPLSEAFRVGGSGMSASCVLVVAVGPLAVPVLEFVEVGAGGVYSGQEGS